MCETISNPDNGRVPLLVLGIGGIYSQLLKEIKTQI
jgi:hypothetical protein